MMSEKPSVQRPLDDFSIMYVLWKGFIVTAINSISSETVMALVISFCSC
jgi:hypothetical protein